MGTAHNTGRSRLWFIGLIGGAVALMGALLLLPRGEVPLPEPEYRVEVVARNLTVPWSIDMDDDGNIYFTERVGRLNMIGKDGTVSTIYAREVASIGEAGMLGLALDPEFKSNGYIYLYYTYSTDSGLLNRVVRLEGRDGNYREHVLLDGIPGGEIHDGGRIRFGPDGMLYITTGDAGRADLAQDTGSLAGKILRIGRDGSIPEDNPFGNAVYSYGHRNPQGLAWHPTSRNLYATEHGPVGEDEINLIRKGANYGWPVETCSKAERYEKPILCYTVSIAPAGAAFMRDADGRYSLFYATLRGQHVERIVFDEGEGIARIENFLTGLGRIRDVYAGKDGYLYIATSNRDGRGIPAADDDRILRVRLQ
ncbi:MAG: PQQ-dependent sugar dehydrogenase [Candidatus Nitrosocaldus sp.]|nr:PQQ-dependent sugar dehydrogenase [Candidatus Nitrosocaldus sp.]MDW8274936.1 PQQ-dependent sugar dehydrogenase [Candidatus Nitrosocaldus sp.]